MVETGNECQHTDCMSSRCKNCYGGLLRGSVVPAKFLLVLLNTMPGNGARRVVIHVLNLSSLAVSATHDSLFLLSPHFAHGSGALGFSVLIHGSTLCRQLKSCLREWSISRMKLCRQDNDKVQRNRRWQRPNNVSSSYPQEAVHLPSQLESSRRAHWASRRRSLVSQRNGQLGNSRSRHLRVLRTQE